MFRSEQSKMKLYRANLGREAKNQFKQGQALDEYLLHEQGIESQQKGTSQLAEAIGDQIGKTMRVVKPVDRLADRSDDVIRAKSVGAPKSIKQPPQPKDINVAAIYEKLINLDDASDYELREKFDSVLDGISSEAKTIADKRLYKQLKDAIEKQRLADAYKDWTNSQIESQFATKLQRNLQNLLNQKRANVAIAENKAQRGLFKSNKSSVVKDLSSMTIAERMANLRALKAAKRTRGSSDASTLSVPDTELDSLADMDKVDARQFNPGRPSKSILEKYQTMQDIISKPRGSRTKEERKKLANLKGKINKDSAVLSAVVKLVNNIQ